MRSKIKTVFLVTMLTPVLAYAELTEDMIDKLNEDYAKVETLRNKSNPDLKNVDQVVAEKDKTYMESLQKKMPKKQFEVVSKNITESRGTTPAQIEKAYLEKVNSNKKLKVNEKNKDLLNDFLSKSEERYKKNFNQANLGKTSPQTPDIPMDPLSSSEKGNSENKKIDTANTTKSVIKKNALNDELIKRNEEELKTKQAQQEALTYSKAGKNKLRTEEDDSLFTKVSKAYHRNLDKVIKEDEGQADK